MKADRKTLALENRRISILLELLIDKLVAQKGLSATQTYMLLFILRNSQDGTSLTDIHRAFGFSMATLSNLLKRLRKSGYVRVEPCTEDNRRKLLYGTEKGRQLEQFLHCAICHTCDQVYQGFTESELLELDHLQKKMIRNLSVQKDHQVKDKRSEYCEKSPTTVEAV